MIKHVEDLAAHLAKGPLNLLYTIYGEEQVLALDAADQIRDAAYKEGFVERQLLTVESGFDWTQLFTAQKSLSLFADKKLIELRLLTTKLGTQGSDALIKYLAYLLPNTITLAFLTKPDLSTLNSKWFKTLTHSGYTIIAKPLSRSQLTVWIRNRLFSQQQTLSSDALHFLCDQVEGNFLAAKQAIQQLALLYPPGEVDLSALQAGIMHAARYPLFQLSMAILQANPVRYTQVLHQLIGDGVAPALILWTLTEEIRLLLNIAYGKARAIQRTELYRSYRVWGEKIKWIDSALQYLSVQQLENALIDAAGIDTIIKGMLPGNVEDALHQLGLSLIIKTASRFSLRIE